MRDTDQAWHCDQLPNSVTVPLPKHVDLRPLSIRAFYVGWRGLHGSDLLRHVCRCSIRLGIWGIWRPGQHIGPFIVCSLSSSWAVFAVYQGALSCQQSLDGWFMSSGIYMNASTQGFPAGHHIVMRWSMLFTPPISCGWWVYIQWVFIYAFPNALYFIHSCFYRILSCCNIIVISINYKKYWRCCDLEEFEWSETYICCFPYCTKKQKKNKNKMRLCCKHTSTKTKRRTKRKWETQGATSFKKKKRKKKIFSTKSLFGWMSTICQKQTSWKNDVKLNTHTHTHTHTRKKREASTLSCTENLRTHISTCCLTLITHWSTSWVTRTVIHQIVPTKKEGKEKEQKDVMGALLFPNLWLPKLDLCQNL